MSKIDIVQSIIGEYTLLTLVLVVLSTFLNRFLPPVKEQAKFLLVASVGMALAYVAPPHDWQALLYGFVIAGVVVYKKILVEEFKEVLSSIKRVENENFEKAKEIQEALHEKRSE